MLPVSNEGRNLQLDSPSLKSEASRQGSQKQLPRSLFSRYSRKSQFAESESDTDSQSSADESDSRTELANGSRESCPALAISPWEEIYERAELFLDKINFFVVSASPIKKPRSYLRADDSKSKVRSCSTSVHRDKGLSPIEVEDSNSNMSTETDEVSIKSCSLFNLSLTKESSLLSKRMNLNKLERSNSIPAPKRNFFD